MYTRYTKTTFYLLCVAFVFLSGCAPGQEINNGLSAFHDARGHFRFQDTCLSPANNASDTLEFSGSIWYGENIYPPSNGKAGLHWMGSKSDNIGTIPIQPSGLYLLSPDGTSAIVTGYNVGEDAKNSHVYLIKNHEYQITAINHLVGDQLIWSADDKLVGVEAWENPNDPTITMIATDLKTGQVQRKDVVKEWGTSTEPLAQISRAAILAYDWYSNVDGPRLVVFDTKTGKEIGRYKDISYRVGRIWYGRIFDQQGVRIISISDGLDTDRIYKQELFGVEIGKSDQPVQLTDFHSKYPYALIMDFKFIQQSWSPNDRWIIVNVLTSQKEQIDSSTDPSSLFLVDLEKSATYEICREPGTGTGQVVWSPDSQYFGLSLNDKIWVVNPLTLESRLLVDRPGVSLSVLGWTIP